MRRKGLHAHGRERLLQLHPPPRLPPKSPPRTMSWPLQDPDETPTAASCPEQAAILHPRGGGGVGVGVVVVVIVVEHANVPGGVYTTMSMYVHLKVVCLSVSPCRPSIAGPPFLYLCYLL